MTPYPHLVEKLRAWLPALPLVLILAASYWLNQQVLPLPMLPDANRHEIDYQISNISTVTLDQAGRLSSTLTAEKMWHYPDDDTTHLLLPQFSRLYPDRAPTLTSAQTAMLSSKGNDIYFRDEVRVILSGSRPEDEQRISTDYLHLIPERDFAQTNRSVVYTRNNNVIRATGMELDAQARTLNLLSRVRASYVPDTKH